MPAPSLAAVEAITALADPVIRNLQITQCYHELATALAERTGPSANWCTFATWASKQAGATIRKEDLVRAFEGVSGLPEQSAQGVMASAQTLGARLDNAALQHIVQQTWSPLEAFDHASDAVARGNLKVFAEIGRAFARFCAACLSDAAYDAGHIAQFCETFQPGEPPEGQTHLRQAFVSYYQALFEPDAKTRLELLLLANLHIGYHEQVRLQPEIMEALNAPIPDLSAFNRRLATTLFRQGNWLALARWAFSRLLGGLTPLDLAAKQFGAALQRQARLVTTEFLMTLELPDGQLRLGEDLTARFPSDLQHLQNPDLLALLARLDPTPDSTRGTGAADWADLPQRLHFILDLFRCYELAADLFDPPFTAEQVTMFKAGQRPSGRL